MKASEIQQMYLTHSNDVHKFLAYFTRSNDVDDLVQDTFIRAFKSLENFRGGNPKSWLITIARTVAIDFLRTRKRAQFTSVDDLELVPSAHIPLEEWVQFKDEEANILRLINGMKSSYRDVLICRTFMDMASDDTAQVLGWSTNRVNVTLHRAIKALRALLIAQSGGEGFDLATGR